MSILNAMYSGVSGLTAEGDALGVIGDNVSNTSTIGFKESRAVFENVLGGAIGDPNAVGAGVRMEKAQQIFAQGTLQTTGNATDLALSGDGFLVVAGNVDGTQGNFYTRDGQTTLNKDGTLVNQEGLDVQGYPSNGDGTFSSKLGNITVPTSALSPKPTTGINVTANLDSTSTTPTVPWDPTNPAATSNFSTSMKVYDSLGTAHSVDVYFRNEGGGNWSTHAIAQGSEVSGGTAGVNDEIATGTMSFNSSGALQTSTTGPAAVTFNGAGAQSLAFNFGSPISAGGTGLGGTTQFGSASNVSAQTQDGYASGNLTGVTVDGNGVVNGNYTNGQTIAVAQLAVAKFQSNDGLGKAGHNLWVATNDSGVATIGAAGTGGRAAVVSGSLEQSNVDIAGQFVDLIAHQRAFQANSKTITTADQMLQDVISMKQ
ncbi:MAG: flagellar hook protein FlgE [Polyangiaceae bacterium]